MVREPPAKANRQAARKSAAALTAAVKSWTGAGSEHVLTLAGTTTAGFAVDDRNTISWAKGNGCTGTCLAITSLVLQSGQVIVESDISFNAAQKWQTTGKGLDIQTTAPHELGHALGIHHTEVMSGPRPSMYSATSAPRGGRWRTTTGRLCGARRADTETRAPAQPSPPRSSIARSMVATTSSTVRFEASMKMWLGRQVRGESARVLSRWSRRRMSSTTSP